MKKYILHHYNTDHNTTSAREIIPYILNILPNKPKSVMDVGCGVAQWLKVFKENGVKEILGLDGFHVPKNDIMVDSELEFHELDLCNIEGSNFKNKFDLILNLEVAEHLPIEKADQLIDFLTASGDVIIFSAAVKGQSGENHLNEQNPSYWQKKFIAKDFVMLDAFRDKFWNNESVNWWYRQNMYLVVHKDLRKQYTFNEFKNFYVHPDMFNHKEEISKKKYYSFKDFILRKTFNLKDD